MLDISKPLTSGKVQTYFRDEYSAASNSYFTQSGTLQGHWHGQLAAALDLSGAVSSEAFDRLADGQHPRTGEQLIRHRDTIKTQAGEELGHRAGWDLTFNAPKTVTLTALVGGDERVRLAHRNAVRAALDSTECYVQARLGGTHAAETTGKWIAATFDHDTSRPVGGYPAPHLHTHVIVFNMTEDANGQARSLQPYELFRIQSMATAIYQNKLEAQLRQFGYSIERGTNHAPDIKGYTQEYLAAESLRAAQLQRDMEARGLEGRDARVQLAHQNREDKLRLAPDELRAMHQKHAEEFGDQPRRIIEQAIQAKEQAAKPAKNATRAEAAVTFARNRLSERSSVFEHFEVIRDALRHVQGKASLPQIEAELDRQKAAGKFIEVQHVRPNAPAFRYTTPELIQAERETIERVLAGRNTAHPIALFNIDDIGQLYPKLNEDQRRLVRDVLASTSTISGVQGGAGTGKTTALAAVCQLAEQQGFKAHGLGPTSRAAKGLKEAGMEAETLQAYLARSSEQRQAGKPRLFFVDESSLASSKQIHTFLQTLAPQDRVLFIGDTRQHQSVEAGRIFEQLQDVGMDVAHLSKIIRQKDDGLRQVVEAIAAGHISEGVDLLTSQGRVHSVAHRKDRLRDIAATYAEHPEGTVVISPDNRSRQELNSIIRDALRQCGKLGPDTYEMEILINRQALTAEDRGVAASYRVGDSVRYLKGSQSLRLEAKTYATVVHVDAEANSLTVQTEDGRIVTYNPQRLHGVTVYATETRSVAVGERVQFTAPWKSKAVSNRDLGTVTYLDQQGNIRVSLDDSGRTVSWNLNDNKHLDYAYAMTSHSFQGATVDRVLVHVDTSDTKTRALVNETLGYVALSRPRFDAQVFTDNADQLSAALSRKQQNATALTPATNSHSCSP